MGAYYQLTARKDSIYIWIWIMFVSVGIAGCLRSNVRTKLRELPRVLSIRLLDMRMWWAVEASWCVLPRRIIEMGYQYGLLRQSAKTSWWGERAISNQLYCPIIFKRCYSQVRYVIKRFEMSAIYDVHQRKNVQDAILDKCIYSAMSGWWLQVGNSGIFSPLALVVIFENRWVDSEVNVLSGQMRSRLIPSA